MLFREGKFGIAFFAKGELMKMSFCCFKQFVHSLQFLPFIRNRYRDRSIFISWLTRWPKVGMGVLDFALCLLLGMQIGHAQVHTWDWAKSNAGGGSGTDWGWSIAVDGSGNSYVAGLYASSEIQFGSTTLTNVGHDDGFVVKYDPSGNVLWATGFGGPGEDGPQHIAVDGSGNCYVVGWYGSPTIQFGSTTLTNPDPGANDMFVVKYDPSGNVLWAQGHTGGSTRDCYGYGIAVDGSGNCFVVGYYYGSTIQFGSTTLTNAGGNDIFVVKYDPSGNALWARSSTGGGTSDDDAMSVAVDGSGNCYVIGEYWSPTIQFGSTTLTNDGICNAFIVAYDPSGNVLWANSSSVSGYSGLYYIENNGVDVDGSGNCYVVGSYSSPTIQFGSTTLTNAGGDDIFIVKYDRSGNVLWAKSSTGGGSNNDGAFSVAVDGSGNCYVVGWYASPTIQFGPTTLTNPWASDMFLVEYSPGGSPLWATGSTGGAGTGLDFAHAVSIDGSGNCYVAGWYSAPTIQFGSTTLTNAGGSDMFVAKLGCVCSSWTEAYSGSLADVGVGSVAWGDYDNDGKLDILLTGITPSSGTSSEVTKIYHNTGSGFEEVYPASLTGVYMSSVAWGDYDNDGKLDILVTGSTGSGDVSKIYHNTGSGFEEVYSGTLTGVHWGSVAWGDYDNDGKLDILLTGIAGSSYITKIYHNTGSGFEEVFPGSLTGVGESSVAWGDYDNDGKLDILLSGSTGYTYVTKIYHNTGSGFEEVFPGSLTAVAWSSVAWGDYDNDGKLDILISGNGLAGYVSKIYHNTASGFEEVFPGTLAGIEQSSVAWGDYDNDGKLDILLTGWTGSRRVAKIYHNAGSGFEEAFPDNLTGVSACSIAWGDYDNDGKLDILLTGESNSSRITKLYHNNTCKANTVPSAPSDLQAIVSGRSARLTWHKGSDPETPQNGLSYNVLVGTDPGSVNIQSPMANTATGWRRVVQLGNVDQNTNYTISKLPVDTYYWSVQSIDNAYAGSPFASGGSFVIRDQDLSVNIFTSYARPLTAPCCGSRMDYFIVCSNVGTEPVNDANFVYHYPQQFLHVLGWGWPGNFSDWSNDKIDRDKGKVSATATGTLNPGQSRVFFVQFQIQCNQIDTPMIACTATVYPTTGDVAPDNNTTVFSARATCSHDPNDKYVFPHGCGSEGYITPGDSLTYTLHFQNTGTGPAHLVVVRDTLDVALDIGSVINLGSTHANIFGINTRELSWTFDPIDLPAEQDDTIGSNGFITFRVRQMLDNPPGTVIQNRAGIYFDLNPVVMTNTTTNTITTNPIPVADFTVHSRFVADTCRYDFSYTGGTPGATFLWNFGSGAIPETSMVENPTGVCYSTPGDKIVTLQVQLGDCTSDPAVKVVVASAEYVLATSYERGWNLVCVPVEVDSNTLCSVFPTAVSEAFAYERQYIAKDTLETGRGYWLKFPSEQSVRFKGVRIDTMRVPVQRGWNLIGVNTSNISVARVISDPPGLTTSPFYGYDRRYCIVDTLCSPRGYWVKSSGTGTLIFSAVQSEEAIAKKAIRVTLLDELPPPPPGESATGEPSVPKEYKLEQNYPNPFNPTTTFRYDLPQQSSVTLKIYNVLGQVVQSLVDGMESAGYKSVEWNANSLASGIYFYRLAATSTSDPAKSFTQVKKMLLLK